MSSKYLFRLDDACQTMDLRKWLRLEAIFDQYDVRPIVAVIPKNSDKTIAYQSEINEFWDIVRRWQGKGWTIGLHGYNHVYTTKDAGVLSINRYSEFSGVDPEIQETKIKSGIRLMRDQSVEPKCWIAPAHSFDVNTIKILKSKTNIEFISDGYAFFPYTAYGMRWLPQLTSTPRRFPFGIWTFCLHPNTISMKQIEKVELFVKANKTAKLGDMTDLSYERDRDIIDYLLQYVLIATRKTRYLLQPETKSAGPLGC